MKFRDTPIAPLFVPGSQPDRFIKAIEKSAGDIIIDLEDAVADSKKQEARDAISFFLSNFKVDSPQTISVRINAPGTIAHDDDVAWLKNHVKSLDYVVLPMVEEPEQVSSLYRSLISGSTSVPILAQIETARGVLNAPDIATAEGLLTFAFGAADYANEIGVSTDGETQFLFARSALINACASAKLSAPLDSPYFELSNEAGLCEAVCHSRELGFGGKLCIHPKQTGIVDSAFRPTEAEIEKSREIVRVFEEAEQSGKASVKLKDGTFIDYPVYYRAQKRLLKAH